MATHAHLQLHARLEGKWCKISDKINVGWAPRIRMGAPIRGAGAVPEAMLPYGFQELGCRRCLIDQGTMQIEACESMRAVVLGSVDIMITREQVQFPTIAPLYYPSPEGRKQNLTCVLISPSQGFGDPPTPLCLPHTARAIRLSNSGTRGSRLQSCNRYQIHVPGKEISFRVYVLVTWCYVHVQRNIFRAVNGDRLTLPRSGGYSSALLRRSMAGCGGNVGARRWLSGADRGVLMQLCAHHEGPIIRCNTD